MEKYFVFLNSYENLYAKEFDSNYVAYRDIDQKGKTDYINKKLNILSIHEQLSKLDLKNTQMDFDGTSLYPSAMWDENSVYPRIESGYTFKLHKNEVFVNDFINQTLIKMVMTQQF